MVVVLAPLVAILLAVVAALLLYCWYQIVYFLSLAIIPELPGVFGYVSDFANWLAGKAADAANNAYERLQSWADSAIGPAVDVLNAIVAGNEALWDAVLEFSIGTAQSIKTLTTVTIPSVVSHAVDAAQTVILQQVETRAQQATHDAIDWAQGEANTVWSNTLNLVNASVGQLQTVIGGIEATLSQVPAAIDGAEHRAEGWAAGAIDQLRGWAEGAIEAVRGELLGGIGQVAGELHGFEGQTNGALGQLGGRADLLEHATEIVLPAAIATVAADVLEWRTKCGDPLCNELGPLAELVNTLGDMFSLGLFIAWLAYCVRDPEDAAHDTVAVGGPIADAVGSAVTSVV